MTPEVEALKPCPFCGGDAELEDWRGGLFRVALHNTPGLAEHDNGDVSEIQRQRQVIEAWREAYIKATGSDQ
jgi:hypothetical protein